MHALEQPANERIRGNLEMAERLRRSRHQRTLRRARRMEHKAERRMIQAWRRAAELRTRIELLDQDEDPRELSSLRQAARGYAFSQASRSALMVSACVVGMPCG